MPGKKTVQLPPEKLKINVDEEAYRKKYRLMTIVFVLFVLFYLLRTYKYHELKDSKTNRVPQQMAYAISTTFNFILDGALSLGAGMIINAIAQKFKWFWSGNKNEQSVYKGFN